MSTVSTPLKWNTTIGTLADEVVIRVENRLDLLTRAWVWVKDSLIEITSMTDLRDDFDELEIWGAPYVLTPLQVEYPFSELMPEVVDPVTGASNPALNMATLDVLLWVDPPTNSQYIQLSPTHYQDADRGVTYSKSGGQPSEWYRFGNNIGFNQAPSQAYQVQARILRMHPINWGNLSETPVIINTDWHDVIKWGAVERGFMELLEFDKAESVNKLIHGDPKYPMKIGLLQGAKKRRKREGFRKTVGLRPILRTYSWGR